MEQPKEREPQGPCGYYGTGRRRETEKSHVSLIIALLALMLMTNLITVAVHIELRDQEGEESAPPEESVMPYSVSYPTPVFSQENTAGGKTSFGMEISDLDEAERRYWELPEGVIVCRVAAGSSAAAAGILPGDIVLAIGDAAVSDTESYLAVAAQCKAGEPVKLTIFRGGVRYDIELAAGEE